MTTLQCIEEDLRDLAEEKPALVTAGSGRSTGIRLVRWLGAGNMSAVFLGERDPSLPSGTLSELTPGRLAIKFIKPTTERQLSRLNLRSTDIARREIQALDKVQTLRPPTEFIVTLYGHGASTVQMGSRPPQVLPWIALEYVDGGSAGSTLTQRVEQARDEGIDPVRALRLARGILEGASVFHRLGIIHKDIKPDNVFVAGPVDVETPKLADCGIARVEGLAMASIAGMTPEYGGPEQALSSIRPTESNPLVGPWTDVHALAATLWFLITGDTWYRTPTEWDAGERRSLRTGFRLHRGFADFTTGLDALDAVLQRGASHQLPARAWQQPGAEAYDKPARTRFATSMFGTKPIRYETAGDFAAELLPILESCASRWIERAGKEKQPISRFRPTRLLTGESQAGQPQIVTRSIPPPSESRSMDPAGPWDVVFLQGQWGYVRFGGGIFCFSQTEPGIFDVIVPQEQIERVRSSRWLVRGPNSGIALAGLTHILLLPHTDWVLAPSPQRPGGGTVGEIQAVIGDGRAFGVVTTETEDGSGDPELWLSTDGTTWADPINIPIRGEVHALASGPFGWTIVGSWRGRRARALHLGFDKQVTAFKGVEDNPSLTTVVAGTEGEAWAAGSGGVVRLDWGGATREPMEGEGDPMAMGLDVDGIPWLITARDAFRRYGGGSPVWKKVVSQSADAPPWVGIGFTPRGARLFDARGGGILIEMSEERRL